MIRNDRFHGVLTILLLHAEFSQDIDVTKLKSVRGDFYLDDINYARLRRRCRRVFYAP